VQLEVEGEGESLLRFQDRLRSEKPPLATIISLESNFLDPLGFERFVIRESEEGVKSPSVVAPDVGTCLECLAEINDPASRRFQYPLQTALTVDRVIPSSRTYPTIVI
jgi:hydrogenase maturation protein HypF